MREPLDQRLVGTEASHVRIEGGSALIDGHFEETVIVVNSDSGKICDTERDARYIRRLDAAGLLVLPGIVDIHGDAFERQMMPRPGVDFALDIALFESEAQVSIRPRRSSESRTTCGETISLSGPSARVVHKCAA